MTEIMNKAPADLLDYDVDFQRWLPSDDIVVAAYATITESTAIITQVENSESVARVWISGGAAGETGHVTVKINTRGGRIKETCFKLRIRECH